jgi:hypothetical protein
MTNNWQGAIRQAAEQDDDAYCPYCLVENGTDADPLDEYGTTSVDADRADQDTRTLGDTLHVFGWVCAGHDTLCVRDPFEFEPPIDGLLMVVFEGNTGDSVAAHIPVHDLKRDRGQYYHPDNDELGYPDDEDQSSDFNGDLDADTNADVKHADPRSDPPWGDEYDKTIPISENNAPRSCFRCGDSARWYLLTPHKFTCGECLP